MKLPKFLPNIIQPIIDRNKPTYYDLEGKEIKPQEQTKKEKVILDSDTTATIPQLDKQIERIKQNITEAQIEKENNIIAEPQQTGYCVRCKNKQPMHDIKIEDKETAKGIKRFIKGKCANCNGNICVIAKRC